MKAGGVIWQIAARNNTYKKLSKRSAIHAFRVRVLYYSDRFKPSLLGCGRIDWCSSRFVAQKIPNGVQSGRQMVIR